MVGKRIFGSLLSEGCAASIVLAMTLGLVGCARDPRGSEGEVADLVLRGGKVATVDESDSIAEAVAVSGERIVFVGSNESAEAWIGTETEVIELEGRLVIPGFIEGHGHFSSLGQSMLMLDLRGATSWDEIVSLVERAVSETEPGGWIVGRGWHQAKWTRTPDRLYEGVPHHQALSAVSPQHPVLLTHASGHASFANAKALELAGVSRETADPPGGELVRDENGEPTGYLRESAQRLVASAREQSWDESEALRIVRLAGEDCLAKGVTSFQDAGSSFQWIDFYRELAAQGALPVRLWVMVRESNEALAARLSSYRTIGEGDGFLTVRGIKRSIDGALGAHGAWLLEPYTDLPGTSGLNLTDLDALRETARLARENGYQLCVHAIGDRGNRETLDIFEEAMGDDTSLRWRVEHAQHLSPEDIPRFADLGVVASMQGIHCTSDGPWVPERLGEQRSREGAYVWRALLDSGAVISNGTDVPVEDVDPIASYYATVSRLMNDGERFYPEQRMTREEALRSYTAAAAYAAFEETEKGSLEVGKLADIVVLSQDLLTVEEAVIPETEVDLTILNGKIAYARGAAE